MCLAKHSALTVRKLKLAQGWIEKALSVPILLLVGFYNNASVAMILQCMFK